MKYYIPVAAAHELLEALRELYELIPLGPLDVAAKFGPDADYDGLYCRAMDKAKAAIANATGKVTP